MMSTKNMPAVSDVVLSPKTKLRTTRKNEEGKEKLTTLAQFLRELARGEIKEAIAEKVLKDAVAAAVQAELQARKATIIGIASEAARKQAQWMVDQQVKHMEAVMRDVVKAEVARQLAERDAAVDRAAGIG